MKFLKISGLVLLIVVAVLAILTFILPTEFHVEESLEIEADKDLIYLHIISFEKSKLWSPWNDLDPNLEDWIEGTDGKVGAKYFWKGNDDAGEGYQELVSANSHRVEIDLVFLAPFESTAHTYFDLEEKNNATLVKWGFDSEMPRPFNLISLIYDLETAIGKDYKKGLQNLKSKVEGLQE
ncbi:MAG: SRPBCC family protein [Flavobacteriaceae bacterium]|nr:SRPBCC family protein [Flavobacteriaceae bacterium]